MINFSMQNVDGFDKELLLIYDNYVARPVTVDQSTIAGLVPDDKGHYIIPAGTYLYGENGESLLLNPNQKAVAVVPTEVLASAELGTSVVGASSTGTVVVTAKKSGNLAYKFDISKGTGTVATISYASATTTVTILLAVDDNGDVTTTYDDLVHLINNDMVVNSLVTAELVEGYEDTVVVEETGASAVTTTGGGTETVSSDIDGILYHSVDVTLGEATGAMIIKGVINVDNLATEPGAALKAKLPHIIFGRRD